MAGPLGLPAPTISTRALWIAELRAIVALALPIVIQTTAQQAMTVTDQIFLGHLGTAELAAAALANAYTNLMWFFLLGFTTALDTLGSHAYGAGDLRALTMWCITAGVLVTILVVPVAAGMAVGQAVGANLFAQDPLTSALMGRFCIGLIPGMWPLMWGVVLAKYLQVQNVMLMPSLVAVLTFLLNIAFNAVFVSSIGFSGAPLATSTSRWTQCLLLAGAVALHERKRRRAAQQPQSEAGRGGLEGLEVWGQEDGATAAAVTGDVAVRVRSGRGEEALRLVSRDARSDEMPVECQVEVDKGGGTSSGCMLPLGSFPAVPFTAIDSMDSISSSSSSFDGRGGCGGGRRVSCSGKGDMEPDKGSSGLVVHGSDWHGRKVDWEPAAAARRVRGKAAAAAEVTSSSRLWWREVVAECRLAMRPRVVARFLRLGIPGGLSMAFEASCFDFSTVLSGRLGATATAAHAAMMSIVMLTYLACPFSLATAGSIRVGNLLGAGEPDGARRAGILAVSLSGGFMALMSVALLTTRSVLGYLFTTDPGVIRVIRDLALFVALFQVSDGLMGCSQGVLRGCGHQHLTALFNFIGFWLCGLLLSYLLCFKACMGLRGLWIGIVTGDTATCAMNLIAMARIRWRHEADKAVQRLKVLAHQAEEEAAMLGGGQTQGCVALEAEGGADEGGSSCGSAGVGGSPVVGGGGRSYAGGLKRMWSERQAMAARLREAEVAPEPFKDRLFRRLPLLRREQQVGDVGSASPEGVGGAGERRQVELLP